MASSQKFTLNGQRLEAAALLAADELTDEEIAARVGITRRQLAKWKNVPAFAAKVAEIVREFEAGAIRTGIAQRRRRIQAANDRHQRMVRVIEERAADPTMQEIPGGATGLLVRTPMMFGDKYQVDRGLLAELRELEKQVAQDAGQWSEKRELTGKDGGPITTESVVIYLPDNGRDAQE